MEYVIFFGIIIAIIVIAKILAWPLKVLFKLLLNIIFGVILIYLVNLFGEGFGINIPFNPLTALLAGSLGVPGVIILIIINYLF